MATGVSVRGWLWKDAVSAAKFSSMLPDIGVRRLLGKLVNDFLTQEQKKLDDSISNSDFLETIAKKGRGRIMPQFPDLLRPESVA